MRAEKRAVGMELIRDLGFARALSLSGDRRVVLSARSHMAPSRLREGRLAFIIRGLWMLLSSDVI